MLFSSPIFLFLFLPFTLLLYYIAREKYRNNVLLLASLIFFAWGGVSYTIILIASIVVNYFVGLQIQKYIDTQKSKRWLIAGVCINVGTLFVFKYTDFLIGNINFLPLSKPIPQLHILFPIGISFYTFHAISYLVDISRKKATAQRNVFDLSLYIAMFSQLIAGPIIRYGYIWKQLRERTHSVSKFSYGVERFLIGLGKKVLLANVFGRVADIFFATKADELCALTAWTGIICYILQLYTDFSGYSDMAIGLGYMFGFEFPENFNFPYISKNIAEFWRRWHISLSTWINDYIFVPLSIRMRNIDTWGTIIALNITFFLAGLWHGANWTFVIFGVMNGLALTFDLLTKKLKKRMSAVTPAFLYSGLSIFLTLVYWSFCQVFFRADNVSYGLGYMAALFRFHTNTIQVDTFLSCLNTELYLVLLITILGASGFFSRMADYIKNYQQKGSSVVIYSYHIGSVLFYGLLLFVCSFYLIAGTYNPFIYYRF